MYLVSIKDREVQIHGKNQQHGIENFIRKAKNKLEELNLMVQNIQ